MRIRLALVSATILLVVGHPAFPQYPAPVSVPLFDAGDARALRALTTQAAHPVVESASPTRMRQAPADNHCRAERITLAALGGLLGGVVGYNVAGIPDGGTAAGKRRGVIFGAAVGTVAGLVWPHRCSGSAEARLRPPDGSAAIHHGRLAGEKPL